MAIYYEQEMPMPYEVAMAVRSRLPILIAQHNLERARVGEPPLSVRQIALAMGIDHTRLLRIVRDGGPWKLDVLNAAFQYFRLTSFDQLFEYREDER
jgi:hypothetical protein